MKPFTSLLFLAFSLLIGCTAPEPVVYLPTPIRSTQPETILATNLPNFLSISVTGEVKRPGKFKVDPKLNWPQILDACGGYTDIVSWYGKKTMTLYRREGGTLKPHAKYPIQTMEQQEIYLQPGDQLNVDRYLF